MTSGPKRHHQIPQFYLERFASDGKVMVRRRDGKSFDTSPTNVAVESGYYDIPDGMGGTSKEVETGLADIEGMTAGVLRKIDASGRPPGTRDPDRATVALFIGLQVARTTQHREQVLFPQRVLEWAAGRVVTRELVAEYLETEYLGFPPDPGEVEGAYTLVQVAHRQAPETLTQEFAVEMMLKSALEMSKRLLSLYWSIEIDRRRELITSDTPVVLWRKPSPRDNFMGFGIESASEARFPLDPGKLLVMSRRQRRPTIDVGVHRVRRANDEMAGACHRFIVGSPDNGAQMDARRLDRWRPVLRFNIGPGVEVGPDGQSRPMEGDVLHMWTPRRAGVGLPRVPRDTR